jgi:methyl-accepting chemotaxis protein
LVGADATLRSESRFQIETPAAYVAALQSAGISPAVIERIQHHASGIGLQPVRTPGAEHALGGKSGFTMIDDYRGVAVLSAYGPLDIHGLEWGILSEIDRDEAFAPVSETIGHIAIHSALAALVLAALATAVGFWFARSVSRPIQCLTGKIKQIGEQADLTRTIEIVRRDELGDIAGELNKMFRRFREALQQIDGSSTRLSSASVSLSEITEQTRTATGKQQVETDQMATAVEDIAASSREVAQTTSCASTSTK